MAGEFRKEGEEMTLTVCIGSSCHLKGSQKVAQIFTRLIDEHNLRDEIEFYGTFCMDNCQNGISIGLDGTTYSVTPETAEAFFENEVLRRLGK